MKKHLLSLLVTFRILAAYTMAIEWGAATNNIRLSIGLQDSQTEIGTNQHARLVIRFENISTNETFNMHVSNAEQHRGDFSFVITSPSFRSLTLTPSGALGSGQTINLPPNQIREVKFDLSRLHEFDEIGGYKVRAKYKMSKEKERFDIESNELSFSVIDPKRISWGERTNGTRAGICESKDNSPAVLIFIQTAHTNTAPEGGESLATLIMGDYFRAVNEFLGPMELRDMDGKSVEPRRLETTNHNVFPASLSLTDVRHKDHYIYGGPGLPPFTLGDRSQSAEWPIATVRLTNLFPLATNQDYTFTIWPKIYKRTLANPSLCYRLDIPPVTTMIRRRTN
jgi:hypothetical protein